MQDIFGSVRRSLVFRPPEGGSDAGTLADKINSCIRKSKVFARASPPPPPPPTSPPPPLIRWRKGELIGCGAFGQVYMGMNLDSGELLAVKQVLITANDASSKEKSQLHIRELEEEVKLLKNLSHPNIVRYLGTVREENTLNILLEFVPGGSISSLLGKFGPFPEPVIRMYTKQLLLGLDYLHKNGIMHRDIKGANILVDNKGCIKLADFGASKQVVELATMSGTKSMKGTPYWMAPEVILQTGHSFSADIWSVGCTVIEMATGKPPWSQQYQEVAALFYIGTTKSHPPIPEHLSHGAKDLLLKCLNKEPKLRPPACELLQHPFVIGESMQSPELGCTSTVENIETPPSCGNIRETCPGSVDMCNLGTINFSTVNPEKITESKRKWGADNSDDDMCKVDDGDDLFLGGGANLRSVSMRHDFNKSFDPMEEPTSGETYEHEERQKTFDYVQPTTIPADGLSLPSNSCAFPSISEDDDEVIESKIIAFLDEKALELKRLQTPLYEEFYNSINPYCSSNIIENTDSGGSPSYLKLPPKSKSPNRFPPETPYKPVDAVSNASPGSGSRLISNASGGSTQSPREVSSPSSNPGVSFSEVQRKWKEELDRELETKREMMRQVGVGGKTSSPIDRGPNRRSRFASPGK